MPSNERARPPAPGAGTEHSTPSVQAKPRAQRDGRPWLRLDQGFPDNPKVLPLSDSAFRLYVTALCWSARNGTDGNISKDVMHRLGAKPRAVELVKAGLLEDDTDAYRIHDYLKHQESAGSVSKYKAARRDEGRYGAHVRHHAQSGKPNPSCTFCRAEGPT